VSVFLYDVESHTTIQAYEATCWILRLEWIPSGHLVILDLPADVGCGVTAIYDPAAQRIVSRLEGVAYRSENWAPDRTAVFVMRTGSYGPSCDDELNGFDLRNLQPFPPIEPRTQGTDIYAVIGTPAWQGNRILLVTLRDGVCRSDFECTYRNSYVLAVDLTGPAPRTALAAYDPALDYTVQTSADAPPVISSSPTREVTCWEIAEDT
jgi:hypothetical protein